MIKIIQNIQLQENNHINNSNDSSGNKFNNDKPTKSLSNLFSDLTINSKQFIQS